MQSRITSSGTPARRAPIDGAERAAEQRAVDAEAALLDERDRLEVARERRPVGDDVVEARADDAARHGPHGDLAGEPRIAPAQRQLAARDQDRDQDPGASRIPYQRGASGPRWKTNGSDGLGIEASSTARTYRYRPAVEPDDTLAGRVAVVAGGTRGAGRGISVALGARGATVYVTGRSSEAGRPSSTAPRRSRRPRELVDAAGGRGIAVRCDHMVVAEVDALRARVEREAGRLDLLVNDIWGGDALVRWDVPFWEHDLEDGLRAWRTRWRRISSPRTGSCRCSSRTAAGS